VSPHLVLRLGIVAIVVGLTGLVLASGLPDPLLAAIGFAVAALALGLGLRLRRDA
jgi:predicted regulator of Ras-like GTPase activity (Roadblock/LC7/MglB family)